CEGPYQSTTGSPRAETTRKQPPASPVEVGEVENEPVADIVAVQTLEGSSDLRRGKNLDVGDDPCVGTEAQQLCGLPPAPAPGGAEPLAPHEKIGHRQSHLAEISEHFESPVERDQLQIAREVVGRGDCVEHDVEALTRLPHLLRIGR